MGLRGGLARHSSSTEIPLAEIGRENLVLVHVDTSQDDPRVCRGDDDGLIEHGCGLALASRPGPRLSCPSVSRGA
jgi:hypothetical protein